MKITIFPPSGITIFLAASVKPLLTASTLPLLPRRWCHLRQVSTSPTTDWGSLTGQPWDLMGKMNISVAHVISFRFSWNSLEFDGNKKTNQQFDPENSSFHRENRLPTLDLCIMANLRWASFHPPVCC